jgi:death-on-curing family protein
MAVLSNYGEGTPPGEPEDPGPGGEMAPSHLANLSLDKASVWHTSSNDLKRDLRAHSLFGERTDARHDSPSPYRNELIPQNIMIEFFSVAASILCKMSFALKSGLCIRKSRFNAFGSSNMSRKRMKVSELAAEGQLDPEEATLRLLLEARIQVECPTDFIPKSKLSLARRTLGLPPLKAQRTLEAISDRFGVAPEYARKILESRKLLPKGANRVNRRRISHIEDILAQEEEASSEGTSASTCFRTGPSRKELAAARRVPQLLQWRIIGIPEPIVYIRSADILAIHNRLVADFARGRDPIDPPGMRDKKLLDSAANRPLTSLGNILKYPTISMSGAALLHALVHDHPFHNGNKRTALVSLIVFLDKNRYVLTAIEDDIFKYAIKLSAHEIVSHNKVTSDTLADLEMQDIAQWIQRHIKRVSKGEYCLKFHELRTLLTARGCTIEILGGCRADIVCGKLRTHMSYRDDGRDTPAAVIHKIRRDLQLDHEHGVDSDIFYNASARIDDFIVRYRKTLDKLARL